MLLIHPLKGVKQEKTDEKRIAINYHIAELLKEYIESRGDTVRITRNSVSDAAGDVATLARQLKPTVVILVDCAVDINEKVSGYSIQCDHYTALVATWNYELSTLGRIPVTNTGYTVTNKLQYGSTQDIKLLPGYATNDDDLAWLEDETNQEKLVKRFVQSAYAPPRYTVNDTDPAYVEDPYFYTYDSWEETESVDGCSGEILETEYSNVPVRYLQLKNIVSDSTDYTWKTTMTHVGNSSCYFIATVNPHGSCRMVVTIGSQSNYVDLIGTVFKQVVLNVEVSPMLPLYIGVSGSGTLDITGVWVAPQGSLGSLDDPRVQYSMFPPGYRSTKIISYDQPSGISVCLTKAKSLLERAQDDLSTETSTGIAKVVNETSSETVSSGDEGSTTQSITTTSTNSAITTSTSTTSSSSSSSSKIITNVLQTAASVAAVSSFLNLAGGMLSDISAEKNSNTSTDPATRTGEKDNEGNIKTSAESTAETLANKEEATSIQSDRALLQEAKKTMKDVEKGADEVKEANKKAKENYKDMLNQSCPNVKEELKKTEELNTKIQGAKDKLDGAIKDLKSKINVKKDAIAKAKDTAADKLKKNTAYTDAQKATADAKKKYEDLIKGSSSLDSTKIPTPEEVEEAKKAYEEAQKKEAEAKTKSDEADKKDTAAKEAQTKAEEGVKSARTAASEAIKEGDAINPKKPVGAAINAQKDDNKAIQDATPNDPKTKAEKEKEQEEEKSEENSTDLTSAKEAVDALMNWLTTLDGFNAEDHWNNGKQIYVCKLSKCYDLVCHCWHKGMTSQQVKESSEQAAWYKSKSRLCLYALVATSYTSGGTLSFLSPEKVILKKVPQDLLSAAMPLRIKTKPSYSKEEEDYNKLTSSEKEEYYNESTAIQSLADPYWVPDESKFAKGSDKTVTDKTKIPLYSSLFYYAYGIDNGRTFQVPTDYEFEDEIKLIKAQSLSRQVLNNFALVKKEQSNENVKPYDYNSVAVSETKLESEEEVTLTENATYSSVGYIYSGEKYKVLYKYDSEHSIYVPCTDEETVSFLKDSTINGVKYESKAVSISLDDAVADSSSPNGGSIFKDIKLVEYVDLTKKLPLDIVNQILDTEKVPDEYKVSRDVQKSRVEAAAVKERIVNNAAGLTEKAKTSTSSSSSTSSTSNTATSIASALSSANETKKSYLQKIAVTVQKALAAITLVGIVSNFLKK